MKPARIQEFIFQSKSVNSFSRKSKTPKVFDTTTSFSKFVIERHDIYYTPHVPLRKPHQITNFSISFKTASNSGSWSKYHRHENCNPIFQA